MWQTATFDISLKLIFCTLDSNANLALTTIQITAEQLDIYEKFLLQP